MEHEGLAPFSIEPTDSGFAILTILLLPKTVGKKAMGKTSNSHFEAIVDEIMHFRLPNVIII